MNKTGFGFLRLPMTPEGKVDYGVLNPMVDRFLTLGGRYFDTGYTYLDGLSEEAIRESLVRRHPRDRFLLADKLPGFMIQDYDECQRYFDRQLQRCGVDYFDVYLLHGLNRENYELAQRQDQFRFLREKKAQGRARRIGFSYHDSPELLDTILNAHPEVDVVVLQINYLDWNSPALQAEKLYTVAADHGKTVVVMEPVKGGHLAVLPEEAGVLLRAERPEDTMASWAIRFATDLDQVAVVLSGMNTLEQLEDNLRCHAPLTDREKALLERCAGIIRSKTAVGCTGCGYCLSHCPVKMPISRYFTLYNEYARSPEEDWKMQYVYDTLGAQAKVSDCVQCGRCQAVCPQKLPISEHLLKLGRIFAYSDDMAGEGEGICV